MFLLMLFLFIPFSRPGLYESLVDGISTNQLMLFFALNNSIELHSLVCSRLCAFHARCLVLLSLVAATFLLSYPKGLRVKRLQH